MSKFFYGFPKVPYLGKTVTDISRRVALVNIDAVEVYLPYTVSEGEKPEDIANFYYGSVEHTWLIYFANSIIDVNDDWVKSVDGLNASLIARYPDKGDTPERILNWTQRTDILENIVEFHLKGDIPVSRDTGIIDLVPASERYKLETLEGQKELYETYFANQDTYEAIRIYEMENWLNEKKRQIRIIDKKYLNQALKEFKDLMSGGGVRR